ncbi:hypothetical protein HPQ61_19860 [Acetobacteraceae bacterium]|nr:hypothetical protein [Acetobacteraceae bacterium]
MGPLGNYLVKRFSSLFVAALWLPAVWTLPRIQVIEIDYAQARAANPGETEEHPARYRDLLKNREMLIFGGPWILFQVANASAIPEVTERLSQHDEGESELIVAGMIIVPEVIIAALALWIARRADIWGLRLLLLTAFVALGPLIIAEVTAGIGRYNLAQGKVDMATGIVAALSMTAVGYITQWWFGFTVRLLVLAVVAGFVFVAPLLRESNDAAG